MKSKTLRSIIRRIANEAGKSFPIKVVEGDSAPKSKGSGYFYTTPSGNRVYHPNAYRAAWGKPIYHHSTIRIEVGNEWPMHMGLLASKITQESISQ